MPDAVRSVLLDQNIPRVVAGWLRDRRKSWKVSHVTELGFVGKSDEFLYLWAQEHRAIIVTYDEDFADARMYPLGRHHGVVRLRVWPTTIEKTQEALERLMAQLPDEDWPRSLIIVENQRIRVRRA